jgi:hypothetical protein
MSDQAQSKQDTASSASSSVSPSPIPNINARMQPVPCVPEAAGVGVRTTAPPPAVAGGEGPRADLDLIKVRLLPGRAQFFLNSGDPFVDCWRAKIFGFQMAVFDYIHMPLGGDC